MGAKDTLCKVAMLSIFQDGHLAQRHPWLGGLEGTRTYYTADCAGFKKTLGFQPCIIKQNRGSPGEGHLDHQSSCENWQLLHVLWRGVMHRRPDSSVLI